ncbi:MAG TPA: hypothetical protein VD735_04450 [Candidatus Saccharimonadales bacterium]|nr:hypothetical protein [Candidatus Saccharimonadales bacterium]
MWQEIGKTFNGKKFTLEDYLDMESRYVEAAMAFLADSGVDKLTAYDVVTGEPSERIVALGLHQQITLKNRQSVTPEQIPTLLRAMLREDIGCSFAAPRKFTLSVGWDYYMYISCHTPAKNAVAKAEALGLYVEPLDPLE